MEERQPQDSPAAVALGFFDGVHLGHQAVIKQAAAVAKEKGLRLAVFTFTQGFKGGASGLHILTSEQKHQQLELLGVDTCYEPPFSSFQALSPQAFFKRMLVEQYNAKAVFCGDDFFFGAKRAGNTEMLAEFCAEEGISISIAPMTLYDDEPVSSSRIKRALAAGEIEVVNAMLGRPYAIDFTVQHGKKLGSKLGFPTINQIFPQDIQPPALGVYVTKTLVDGRYWPSATGFSTRPSVDNGPPSCETFIPGFEGDLYGGHVEVSFYTKIAEPRRFEAFDELARAVQEWARAAKEYFATEAL